MSETTVRRLRLGSGLVLFAYISFHLLNHALGAVSLERAEQVLGWSIALWHSRPGSALLNGATGVHFALALRTVFLRRNWKLPAIEIIRLGSGFSLPLLLIGYVVSTRLKATLYDVVPSYGGTVSGLVTSGAEGWQLALLAPGWIHGCLGLWITLRRYRPLERAWPGFLAVLILVPGLAALGFVRMAAEVSTDLAARQGTGVSAEQRDHLLVWQTWMTRGYLALIVLAVAAGELRRRWLARGQ
ncbi:MAG: hypothetical protein JNK84_20675 [Phreatobacter sp.]|uniref:hypothetical protein n=1 Tax=Phreatobacter sp. TaxID=1966341 RepID=UPI001A36FAD8|nr:hypothetical protein [Phreatobacter sp.]MBL8571498.1 hypothetical protein [Phreatobacter sp.]